MAFFPLLEYFIQCCYEDDTAMGVATGAANDCCMPGQCRMDSEPVSQAAAAAPQGLSYSWWHRQQW